ncbi:MULTISPECIES: amidohydrolase family protein [Sphingobium]|jgi:L-fuconolactonase|uniref:Amidohydrolase family protein n=1 Tax=Sphingobium limneticum TaxID=1007511 RepID=A0A5J5IDN6_9SPHN|nr:MULTISPECIES: amidohydrolase family protein [Sphingobium]MBU0930674.1 amidohydrolase family protein [Alphaproteobacteria bacterium]KAA9020287.1 amidohydrolase family protein [Sphingobium limneticum]KAA9021233.1 amidohydrolase family protein [Sphingobium limneticum]KAA9033594.1 amidohydrolase family protein [Sphingobium limneticum]BBD03027.1 L-fuconolactonase [Sphingobium sp. YG1]
MDEHRTARPRILDSHHHYWRIGGPGQAWPDAGWPLIHRDFLPTDLRAATDGLDLVGTVLVQSQPDDRDTDWMLALAAEDTSILAVVGWVALDDAGAPARIAQLARHPKLVGLRPMLQSMDDSDWILRDACAPAIDAMLTHGLRFDALVQPRHLPAIGRLAQRWPDLPIVIDHGAKPFAAQGRLDPWRDDLAALARFSNIWCKLSGLRTEQAPGQSADALAPYVAHILAQFGDRTMWGSDWPVLLQMGDRYSDWVDATVRLAGPLDADGRARLFEGAARAFYGLLAD